MLRFADMTLDENLVRQARRAAQTLLESRPDLAARHVARWLGGRAEYLKA
jgi:ATP-dependent DNA helicase RecG